jgi:hypothetical protein
MGAGPEMKKRKESAAAPGWELGNENRKELKCPLRQQPDGI